MCRAFSEIRVRLGATSITWANPCGGRFSSRELLQERTGLLEVSGVKALREPAVGLCEVL